MWRPPGRSVNNKRAHDVARPSRRRRAGTRFLGTGKIVLARSRSERCCRDARSVPLTRTRKIFRFMSGDAAFEPPPSRSARGVVAVAPPPAAPRTGLGAPAGAAPAEKPIDPIEPHGAVAVGRIVGRGSWLRRVSWMRKAIAIATGNTEVFYRDVLLPTDERPSTRSVSSPQRLIDHLTHAEVMEEVQPDSSRSGCPTLRGHVALSKPPTRKRQRGFLAARKGKVVLPGEAPHDGIVRAYVKLFTVDKSNGTLRIVGDGRDAGEWCQPPPRFHIMPVDAALKRIIAHVRRFPDAVFLTGDLKHAFYRQRCDGVFSQLFTVTNKRPGDPSRRFWTFRRLIMGHSWSPWLCQSTVYSAFLYRETGENSLGVDDEAIASMNAPPGCITFAGGGFCSVTLDNLLVACPDREAADLWLRRISRNVKLLDFELKGADMAVHEASRFAAWDHLGVDLEHHHTEGLRWRVQQDRVNADIGNGVTLDPSRFDAERAQERHVARANGRVVHWCRVALKPLLDVGACLIELGESAPRAHAAGPDGWDAPATVAPATYAGLRQYTANAWRYPRAPRQYCADTPTAYFCSDAMGKGKRRSQCAFVSLDDPRIARVWHHEENLDDSIVYVEFAAMIGVLEHADAAQHGRWRRLVIGCDNMAVVLVCRRLHVKTRRGQQLLRRFVDLCETKRLNVVLRYIATDRNPSDAPSRQLDVTAVPERGDANIDFARTWLRLDEEVALARKLGTPRYEADFEDIVGSLPHPEALLYAADLAEGL
jgi:hypothetical protein